IAALPQPVYDPAMPLPSLLLVGRDRELVELKRNLRNGGSGSVIALSGLPGVGKTDLARNVVYDPQIRSHFSDGILWAGLGPQPDVASILSHWSILLDGSTTEIMASSDPEARTMILRRVIGSRRILLMIDDAWRIEDAMAFQVGGSNCMHLITTR